jgi:hypothetical protein
MTEIVALLQIITPLLGKTTSRQMRKLLYGMLVTSGRITMLGLPRWTEKGGAFGRTVQRFYHTVLPWRAIHRQFFVKRFLKPKDEYVIACDETVLSKAGKETYGLDRFFRAFNNRLFRDCRFLLFPCSMFGKNNLIRCR